MIEKKPERFLVVFKSKLLIEQHFHGCFGIDFNTCNCDDVLFLSSEIKKYGIGGIFPTLVTDSVDNINRQISVIKEASKKQTSNMAKILGIHLEGIFINPQKKGIHNSELILEPAIENYKLIEDDFIKIVTLAPELDKGLIGYLKAKNIKVQAGHCVGGDLNSCNGVTHLFNAMSGINHRESSTALSALINDDIYTEIIADGVHLSDDVLKLVFKTKPIDKIILVSDCLPITKSSIKETNFAGEVVYYDGNRATSKSGTIAGSTVLLPEVIKRLHSLNLFNLNLTENVYNYHSIELDGCIIWDDEFNIVKIEG